MLLEILWSFYCFFKDKKIEKPCTPIYFSLCSRVNKLFYYAKNIKIPVYIIQFNNANLTTWKDYFVHNLYFIGYSYEEKKCHYTVIIWCYHNKTMIPLIFFFNFIRLLAGYEVISMCQDWLNVQK